MALNIKNHEVEKLLDEVVQITGESKTEAVRKALEERRHRLTLHIGASRDVPRLLIFLQDEVWPQIPDTLLGVRPTQKEGEVT